MEYDKIMQNLNNKIYHPVYFLAGEEPYFIDKISKAIEKNVLSDEEKEFNQVIVYGRDTDTNQILTYTREYPVFANYRLVIVREAQNLKDIEKDEKLKAYLRKPVTSTILVFDYKYNKIDGRTEFAKLLEQSGILFHSKKLFDNQIPDWIGKQIELQGFRLSQRSRMILAENLGNNLGNIENEIGKLMINMKPGTEITPEDIERNIGINKDYNVFELQEALGRRDVLKANRIVQYFASNPRDNPAVMVIAILFPYFRKLFLFHSLTDKSDRNVAAQLAVNPYFVKDYKIAAANYNMAKLREIFATLRDADRISKGVDCGQVDDGEILKEMVFRILH